MINPKVKSIITDCTPIWFDYYILNYITMNPKAIFFSHLMRFVSLNNLVLGCLTLFVHVIQVRGILLPMTCHYFLYQVRTRVIINDVIQNTLFLNIVIPFHQGFPKHLLEVFGSNRSQNPHIATRHHVYPIHSITRHKSIFLHFHDFTPQIKYSKNKLIVDLQVFNYHIYKSSIITFHGINYHISWYRHTKHQLNNFML